MQAENAAFWLAMCDDIFLLVDAALREKCWSTVVEEFAEVLIDDFCLISIDMDDLSVKEIVFTM